MGEFSFRSVIKRNSSTCMQGFDYERARTDLQIPDNFDVMAMIAIGRRGPKNNLPPQLQEREQPNDRKPLTEIVMEGQFRQ